MRTDGRIADAGGLASARAALIGLAPGFAVTVGGWAVLAFAAWLTHGEEWWRAVQFASAVWLFWTVQGLRSLDEWLESWRASRAPSGAAGQRDESIGEWRMGDQRTEDRNQSQSRPVPILAHGHRHRAAGIVSDQDGGAADLGRLRVPCSTEERDRKHASSEGDGAEPWSGAMPRQETEPGWPGRIGGRGNGA